MEGPPSAKEPWKCYTCGEPRHIVLKCPTIKKESTGHPASARAKQVCTQVTSKETDSANPTPDSLLFSSSEDESAPNAKQITVTDQSSVTKCAKVLIQGVPAYGLIDSGADITFIGRSLFEKMATIACLKKNPDKVPRTYNQKLFSLDGRMDLEMTFGDKQMTTPIYIKMDTHDQLLLLNF